MVVTEVAEKITGFLKKYKYAFLILLIGLALMLLPEQKNEIVASTPEAETKTTTTNDIDMRLAEILSKIDGAGRVEVMLTTAFGEETIYQTDNTTDQSNESVSQNIETVIVNNSNREEYGLVRQVNPPSYLGAIVVCQGGDRPAVQLAIVEAVSKITGLSSDKISVLKMK